MTDYEENSARFYYVSNKCRVTKKTVIFYTYKVINDELIILKYIEPKMNFYAILFICY